MKNFPKLSRDEWKARDKLLNNLRSMLESEGIRTFIISTAASGSMYLGFEESRMGKLRIGDHNERARYAYRWHIRIGLAESMVVEDKGHKQYFYPDTQLESAVRHMVNYYRVISRNPKPIPI